jgi:hypothetical protein
MSDTRKALAVAAIIAVSLPSTSSATYLTGNLSNGPDSLLYNRSTLILNFGFTDQASTSSTVGPGTVETQTSGFGGGLEFQRWFLPDLAATIYLGGTVVEVFDFVGPGIVSTETAVTSPLLFGVRHHPVALRVGNSIFPFVAAGIGPYFGVETITQTGVTVGTETTVEMAFGGHAAAGVDWYFGRHFNLAVGVGYHAMTSYSQPIGSDDNHSGPEFRMSLGWVF